MVTLSWRVVTLAAGSAGEGSVGWDVGAMDAGVSCGVADSIVGCTVGCMVGAVVGCAGAVNDADGRVATVVMVLVGNGVRVGVGAQAVTVKRTRRDKQKRLGVRNRTSRLME